MSRERRLICLIAAILIVVLAYVFWPTDERQNQRANEQVGTVGRSQAPGDGQSGGAIGDSAAGAAGGDGARRSGSMTDWAGPGQAQAARRQAFVVRGWILSERGARLSGAELRICDTLSSEPCANPVTGFADASGSYEIQLPFDPGAQKLVVVQKPGFLNTEGVLQMRTPGGIEQDYVLRSAAAVLKGRVIGPDDRPVGGAVVTAVCLFGDRFRSRDTTSGYSTVRASSSSTTASALGEFLLTDLPTGNAYVLAKAPGFRQDARLSIVIQPGENSTQVRLETARLISFLVKNRRGELLGGVRVQVTTPGSEATFEGSSDRPGIVELNLPPTAANVQCEVVARGYRSKSIDILAASPPSEVILEDAIVLHGVVVTENDLPVSGARINVASFQASGQVAATPGEGRSISDKAGRFEVSLPSEQYLQVSARREGYLESRVWIEKADQASQDLKIKLREPDGALHGVVVDPQGRPVTQFQIQIGQAGSAGQPRGIEEGVYLPPRPPAGSPDLLSAARNDVGFRTAARFDDPTGSFEFPELPAGDLVLDVTAFRGRESLRKTQTVQVRRGMNTEVVIRLEGRTGG